MKTPRSLIALTAVNLALLLFPLRSSCARRSLRVSPPFCEVAPSRLSTAKAASARASMCFRPASRRTAKIKPKQYCCGSSPSAAVHQ